MMILAAVAIGLAGMIPAAVSAEAASARDGLAITGDKIFTAVESNLVVNDGVVLIRDGKIVRVGPRSEIPIPPGYKVIETSGKWVVPGIVEGHSHSGGNLNDLNDLVYLTNPDLRSLDAIYPDHQLVREARTGGISTMIQIPGSGVNMTGFGVIIKSWGHTQKEVVLRYPGVIKIAQSGNPERYWYGVARSYMNWNTRDTLRRLQAYVQDWKDYEAGRRADKPPFDPFWQEFFGVFDRSIPACMHTQIYQVVLESITMMHDEFHIVPIIDHSTFDAFKLGPLAAERGLYVINGPRQIHFDRAERKIWGNASEWWHRGVKKLGINTDAPVVDADELTLQAAVAAHFGLPDLAALMGITIIPARAMQVDDRVGSLEPGKDGDVGIWTGNPVDPRSRCEKLIVNGELAYCRERDDGRF